MSDFINKIITIILVFVMLVLAPILVSYKNDDMLARREILNDVELFIDKVQDTSSITNDDLNKLYLDCNSHGITVDVSVKRLIATAVFDTDTNLAQTNYFAVSEESALQSINDGDIIQVSIKELGISPSRRASYKILGLDESGLEFTLAGVVG